MFIKQQKRQNRENLNLPQIGAIENRSRFWKYCVAVESASRSRAKKMRVDHQIDAYFVDALLVDQAWECAVSGVRLEAPSSGDRILWRHPLGPSLDRIDSFKGYVPGNLRIVCNLVNCALNEWGAEPFLMVARAIVRKTER